MAVYTFPALKPLPYASVKSVQVALYNSVSSFTHVSGCMQFSVECVLCDEEGSLQEDCIEILYDSLGPNCLPFETF